MNDLGTDSVQGAIAALKDQGYGVRRTPGPQQREASYAFVLSRPGMARALFGPARSSVFAAWASAQEHAEQGATPASTQRLTPFYSAELPQSAFDASACNKDYSCANGFCPSFVSVMGGSVKKGRGLAGSASGDGSFGVPPAPTFASTAKPYGILVTGVGGTGVVTIGALIGMAAHI